MNCRSILLILIGILIAAATADAQQAGSARLKELVVIEGAAPVQLTGYGIVVGLDRTGDRARGQRGSPYTVQSIANMLRQFGINVDPNMLQSRNAAAVMVTTTMDPFSGAGSALDVTVSALGDARSLTGGVLLQTPLMNPLSRTVHAMAQGPLSTGAVLASNTGSSVQINHSNTGRIPNGASIVTGLSVSLGTATTLNLSIRKPDFTNAQRIAEAINAGFPEAARVEHAGRIVLTVPQDAGGAAGFMANLERLSIQVDLPARVVINERTGTIVAGGNVRISEVMVTYGSIVISTQTNDYVSQPPPLSGGETVQGQVGTSAIQEDGTRSLVLQPNTDVTQLAAALNSLGVSARDVIAIFQAIDRAGALQGELLIL